MGEERITLRGAGLPNAQGLFEVFLITEGQGNGWNFSANVLRESLKLWEGAECFVDHLGFWDSGQSVRDLCGVFYDVSFDESAKGVKAKLKSLGPSGSLLSELGKEILSEDAATRPSVGFSADVGFKAKGRDVAEITRVFSCDLVFEPARGGAFIRALNSVGANWRVERLGAATAAGGVRMAEQETTAVQAAVENNKALETMRNLLNVQTEQTRIAKELEDARLARVQMCEYLMDAALTASKLPGSVQARLRKQFGGKIFEAEELQAAIEDSRKMVSELTGGASVQGLKAVVHGMFNSDDQIRLAIEDLLGVERDEKEKNVVVHRLSGIKEAYLGMQGDIDFYGGFYPERVRFQHTTTTFAGLVKNALNKAIVRHWNELGRAGFDWWKKIATVEHFDTLNQVTWVIFGTVGSLPTVAEDAEYTELKIGDSPETSSFTKYGGYIGMTLEALDRDETRKLRAVPRELASAGIRNISEQVAAIFTSNSAVGPTMADTGALFNSTAVTTAGGHANLLTTALGTDFTAWNVIASAMYNQPMLIANETGYYGTGKKMAVVPRYCLVPRALTAQAEALFMPRWAINNWPVAAPPSTGGPTFGGKVEVLTVPEWTDATDYAAVADPAIVPGIMIGERFGLMPEVFIAGDETSPAMFSNDESRIKVRHFITVGVADFRPLHKENV